jgi:serine/threonine protein kinase
MIIATGAQLGPYTITSPLGSGGMGEVWRAKDTRLNREVAIKVLRASFTHDAEAARAFFQMRRLTEGTRLTAWKAQ